MNMITGNLAELFGSIQGEGLYAGERQIFVRTAGCGMICDYCDTQYGQEIPEEFVIYGHKMKLFSNPIEVPTVMDEIAILKAEWAPVETVSITGGEPLEQGDFVALLARELQARNLRVYVDTNGVEVEGLSKVISHVDVVATDFKLPSSCAGDHWDAHREFLRIANGAEVEIFIKVVIDTNTSDDEFIVAVDTVAETNHRIPLVLQPESGTLSAKTAAAQQLMERVMAYQAMAAKRLETVRVIPQMHRILGVR